MAIYTRKHTKLLFFLFLSGAAIFSTYSMGDKISCGISAPFLKQNLIQITKDPAHDYHVKWSPDGKTLAFTSQRSGEPKIWLIPVEGGKAVKLETGLHGDHHISWSPDSSQIAFDASPGGPPSIYTISLKGGKPKKLSLDRRPNFHPCWSPNGSRIAFASYRTDNADI